MRRLRVGAALVPRLLGLAACQGGEPALSVPTATLDAALSCPASFTSERQPVLLVHGTFVTPEENWSWNYGRALPARGYDVCTVRLPARATGDIQVASEYVVHAVRRIAAQSGGKVDVLGHSQGGLEPAGPCGGGPACASRSTTS
ncbi:hypothetical protein BH18ACT1_BH18ACT1_06010 [soil metagenome]